MRWLDNGKNFVKRNYGKICGTAGALALAAQPAFATGTADTAVTGAFTTMTENLIATIAPIAVAAVGVAVVFLGFKYGRKIFGTVAK